MQVIQGGFGKKGKEEAEKTIQEIFDKISIKDKVPDSFLAFIEHEGELHTICYPILSPIEILGALEAHKFNIQFAMAMGTQEEEEL